MLGRTSWQPWRRDAEIFFVSVLILYLELVLIRWIGTEIRVFAYLGNLLVVVCIFGRGLGGHFFWLGVAFLLREVQTVSHTTLLFGMTWMINAIVISAVLLANLVAARCPWLPVSREDRCHP